MPSFADIEAIYVKLIGYMPGRMKDRVKRGQRIDPEFTDMLETLRDIRWRPRRSTSRPRSSLPLASC